MSFRLFIYYSTLVGAWAAFVGWALARMLAPADDRLQATIYSLFLGLTVAFGLSLVDALWNFSPSQFVSIFGRVAVAMFIGIIGSSACGGIAGLLYHTWPMSFFFIFSWIGLGFLVGFSVSIFDVAAGLARKDIRGALVKLLKCTLGGTVGGVLGGILAWLLRFQVGRLLNDPDPWSPTAVGFVTLGA